MVDRPVIFSAPMVRALLEGRKSQTRRILKPYNGPSGEGVVIVHEPWCEGMRREIARFKPPYAFGDRLWVREAFSTDRVGAGDVFYRADGWDYGREGGWKPSIHMPRRFSRLTLIVTDVRVERVQEITNADALAEGALEATGLPGEAGMIGAMAGDQARQAFELLWNHLHGPEAWQANPWVVAVRFTTERRNIDAKEAT